MQRESIQPTVGKGMILDVDHRLCRWGAWSRRMVARAVGYPPCSPMFKDAPAGKGYGSKPPLGVDDADNGVTDRAVKRLSAEDIRLCIEVYQIGGTTVEIAARIGCHRQRIPERLHRVHQALLGHLQDIEAGC